ncbi:MAG: hypothetical protein JJU03_10445 [Idiomarina sp.]|nr:hypothetical protein [Idiomarina sp.]
MTMGALLTLIFFLVVFVLIMRRAKPVRPARNKATTDSPATTQTRYIPTGNDATLAVLTTSAILAASSSRATEDSLDSGELLAQGLAMDDPSFSDINPATGLPMVSEGGVDVRGNPYGSDLSQSFDTESTFASSSDLSDSFSDPFDIDW